MGELAGDMTRALRGSDGAAASDADPSASGARQAAKPTDVADRADGSVASEPTSAVADDGEQATGAAKPRTRRLGVLVSVAAFAYVLDVVTKIVVVATISNRGPVRLLGGFLTLNLIRNSGAAFSIGVGMTVVFTLIAMAVVLAILRISRKLYSVAWAVSLGLLLGGALGNLTDRLVRSPGVFRGHVVDFIQLPHWAVFNFADSAIVTGGCLMVLLSFRGLRPDGTVHQ
jgi:signal peptidase II